MTTPEPTPENEPQTNPAPENPQTTPDSTPESPAPAQPTPAPDTTPPSDGKSNEQLAHEVLGGLWGEHEIARVNLEDAGHDVTAVFTLVNKRLAGGAPTAYEVSHINLPQRVKNGEWGSEKGLRQRLSAAGFTIPTITHVMNELQKV